MKRTIFLRMFTVFLALIYMLLILCSIFVSTLPPFYKYWFSISMLFLGMSLFMRYICYRIDSNLYSGVLLSFFGIVGIVNFYFKFDLIMVAAGYLFAFAVSSFSVFIKFRQTFHIKVFAFLVLCDIVLIVYYYGFMSLYLFAFLLSVIFIVILWTVVENIKSKTRKI